MKNTHAGMSLLVKLHAYVTHGDLKAVMSTQYIILILYLTMSKKSYFYTVTGDLMKIKIKLFERNCKLYKKY